MILSLIRYPFAAVGMAIDLMVQMRAMNQHAAMFAAQNSATVAASADPSSPIPPGPDNDPAGVNLPGDAPAGSHHDANLMRRAADWIADCVREDPSGEPWTLTRTLLNDLVSRADELDPTP